MCHSELAATRSAVADSSKSSGRRIWPAREWCIRILSPDALSGESRTQHDTWSKGRLNRYPAKAGLSMTVKSVGLKCCYSFFEGLFKSSFCLYSSIRFSICRARSSFPAARTRLSAFCANEIASRNRPVLA